MSRSPHGYRVSTIKRKRIEECFGWMKTIGGLRKIRHRGRGPVMTPSNHSRVGRGCLRRDGVTARHSSAFSSSIMP